MSTTNIVRDFATLNSRNTGYLIECGEEGYRFSWFDHGETTEHSSWHSSQSQAIRAAAQDWEDAGDKLKHPTYLATLRREATKAEKREVAAGQATRNAEAADRVADELESLAKRASAGRWHWSGNIDTGEPYLATWNEFGRCQVLSIGTEDRSPDSREADDLRAYAIESEIAVDQVLEDWLLDRFGQPIQDPRLQFVTDMMCVNARDQVVFEVAPNANTREDAGVYRADIVDIRHPDAQWLAAASPERVGVLLDAYRAARSAQRAVTAEQFEGACRVFAEGDPAADQGAIRTKMMRAFEAAGIRTP